MEKIDELQFIKNVANTKSKKLKKVALDLAIKNLKDNPDNDDMLDFINKFEDVEIHDNNAISNIELVEDYLQTNYSIRFNTISNEFEYYNREAETWEKLNEFQIYTSLKKDNFKISMADLVAILKSNFTPKFNPFRDYFENLPDWDGEDHISRLADYLDVGDQRERFINMIKKWMVRAIACSNEQIFNKQAIVIIGNQNNGKSSFLRWLCPPQLQDYYKEDLATDKDSKIALSTNFIINIDELSTLQKKDINSIKSLMSTERIKERVPYDRTASVMRRHASFVASTDRGEFLSDEAGSVRWICFYVEGIDWAYSKNLDISALWSQAYDLYLRGKDKFNYQLTREEISLNEDYNKQFYIKGAEHESIMYCFRRGSKADHDAFITSSEAIQIIRDNTRFHTPRMTNVSMGKAFRLLNFPQDIKYDSDKKYSIKGYYVKLADEIDHHPGIEKKSKSHDDDDENEKNNLPF